MDIKACFGVQGPMKLKSIVMATVVAAGALAGTAQATPTWTWTVQGTIDNGVDELGLFGTAGQNLAGKQFTKTIAAIVDPTQYHTTSLSATVSAMNGYGVPFTETVTVNGVTVNEAISSNPNGSQYLSDSLSTNANFGKAVALNAGYGSSGNYDFDQAATINTGYDSSGNYARNYDNVYSYVNAFVPSLDFTQMINVSSQNQYTYSYSFFELDHLNARTYYESRSSTFAINAVNTSTNVPEPASIALLGLGFAGMGILRRRKAS